MIIRILEICGANIMSFEVSSYIYVQSHAAYIIYCSTFTSTTVCASTTIISNHSELFTLLPRSKHLSSLALTQEEITSPGKKSANQRHLEDDRAPITNLSSLFHQWKIVWWLEMQNGDILNKGASNSHSICQRTMWCCTKAGNMFGNIHPNFDFIVSFCKRGRDKSYLCLKLSSWNSAKAEEVRLSRFSSCWLFLTCFW